MRLRPNRLRQCVVPHQPAGGGCAAFDGTCGPGTVEAFDSMAFFVL